MEQWTIECEPHKGGLMYSAFDSSGDYRFSGFGFATAEECKADTIYVCMVLGIVAIVTVRQKQ